MKYCLVAGLTILEQMAQKVSLMLLKLITHLLSTEGSFPNEFHPYDIIGDSLRCGRGFPLFYLGISPFIWLFLMIPA